jgi:hypothetical protein
MYIQMKYNKKNNTSLLFLFSSLLLFYKDECRRRLPCKKWKWSMYKKEKETGTGN